MGLVGGSRHYDGGGLGAVGGWSCPSCGAENAAPIEHGCTACGAGRPGRKAASGDGPAPMSPPPITLPETSYADRQQPQGDVADAWASQHPDASVAAAYRAGYMDGIRAARAAQPRPPAPLPAADKVARTMVAALSLFRDQILSSDPEEVSTGEWLSADEVTNLITELRSPEAAHA